jgi:hypothetical protein
MSCKQNTQEEKYYIQKIHNLLKLLVSKVTTGTEAIVTVECIFVSLSRRNFPP